MLLYQQSMKLVQVPVGAVNHPAHSHYPSPVHTPLSINSTTTQVGTPNPTADTMIYILDATFLLPFIPAVITMSSSDNANPYIDIINQLLLFITDSKWIYKGKLYIYYYIQCCQVIIYIYVCYVCYI